MGGATSELDHLGSVEQYLANLGLTFPQRTVRAFHTALKIANNTPLLVLAGISGTGKSLLPRRYAEAMGMHFLSVPVQPRWDGPQDLMGFYNYLEGRYVATPLSRALIQFDGYADWTSQAFKDHSLKDRMLIVLLDEMNLARIEYYFSDFLSRLETRRDIDPRDSVQRGKASLPLDLGPLENQAASPLLFVDRNVMFVGTMNEDESTMTLSDKVVDRAAVMRFAPPRTMAPSDTKATAERSAAYLPKKRWYEWIEQAGRNTVSVEHGRIIGDLNDALALVGRPFAYRTNDAIMEYVKQYPDQLQSHLALADQIEQRILPRLRGVDTNDPTAINAIDLVRDRARTLGDAELAEAIDRAIDRTKGHLFQWSGVVRAPGG